MICGDHEGGVQIIRETVLGLAFTYGMVIPML